MCIGCWEEAGSPQINTLEVGRAAFLAQQVNNFGACHIIVDDMNVEDSDLDYCERDEECRPVDRAFIRSMRALNEAGRISALALADGMWGNLGRVPHIA